MYPRKICQRREVTRSLPELPGDVIQHIVNLARLTKEEAHQLRLLSKDFLHAVRNRNRILAFDSMRDPNWNFSDIKHVFCTLKWYKSEKIPLKEFIFKIRCVDYPGLNIDSLKQRCPSFLINLATKLSPTKVNIRLLIGSCAGDLPQSVFGVKSMVQLSLEDCKLKPVVTIEWPNLKELHLESVFMEDGVFATMMRSSPLLEILEIKSCFNRFSLDLKQYCYRNLRVLSLDKVDTGNDFFNNFERKFPRLEELSIGIYGRSFERMNISGKSLKKIELLKIYSLQDAQFQFDVPNIVRNGFEGIIKAVSSGIKIECNTNTNTETSNIISDSRFRCFPIPDEFPEMELVGNVKNGIFTLTYVLK